MNSDKKNISLIDVDNMEFFFDYEEVSESVFDIVFYQFTERFEGPMHKKFYQQV